MPKHSVMKQLLAAALASVMLLSSLAACQDGEASGTDTTDPTPSTTASAPADVPPGTPVQTEGEPIVLTSDFVIICSDKKSDAMLTLANTLKNTIKTKTGISLSIGHASSQKEKEIVLGYLEDRAACTPAYQTIGGRDYTVHTAENTLVLGAWTNADLSAAVDLMLEKALVREGDQWLVYPYRVNFGDSAAVGVDPAQYRIVYADGAGDYLKKTVVPYLQESLKKQFGVELPAVSDTEPPVDYEIVLGDTTRSTDTVRSYLNDGKKLTAYGHAILAEGTRIYLLSQSEFSLYNASSNFCLQAAAEVGPPVFCVSAEPWFSPAPDTNDAAELAAGADIRVMSYNILHPSWSNVVSNVPVEGRDINVAKILLYYMPDVVGVQETNSSWHSALKKLLVDTGMYAFACQRSNAKAYNMSTFLYNTQTVKLVEEYVLDLDKNSDIRVFSVAVFEKLSDGSRFVVTNTHPAPTSQAANYQRNFADLLTLADGELEKYKDLPVIMTGDFNTKEQAPMYKTFMETAGVKDAKYEAEVLVRDFCTFSGWPNAAPKAGNANCIDHIFVNDKVGVKLFNVVIDHDVEATSDHIPIYADLDLK